MQADEGKAEVSFAFQLPVGRQSDLHLQLFLGSLVSKCRRSSKPSPRCRKVHRSAEALSIYMYQTSQ